MPSVPHSFLLLAVLATLGLPGSPMAFSQVVDSSVSSLDRDGFAAELERLANICEQLGLQQQAQVSRAWLVPPRPDQRILYLPADNVFDSQETSGETESTQSAAASKWTMHFQAARRRHALNVYDAATGMAETNEQEAYRLFWQVLREDPRHPETTALMGELATGLNVRPRLVRGRGPMTDLHWPAGSYSRLDSPHFTLWTRSDAETSLDMIGQLEEFYVLWTQVFYNLWAPPGLIAKKIQDPSQRWPKHGRMQVVLLADRREYLQLLGIAEENIDASVGYYNPASRKSFFYPTAQLQATLFHELTHQLMLEATHIDAQSAAGQDRDIWLLEGIALYMESLQSHLQSWTVGGWESPRMQTARYRGVRDGYWPNWNEFTSAGVSDWKSADDIALLYTHAAGLTHVFMDELNELSKPRLMASLVGAYQNRGVSGELLELLGTSEEQAKQAYQDLLIVDDVDVRRLLESNRQPRELVFCGSQLHDESWQSLQAISNLSWLDVSFSNATDASLKWLTSATSLRRLSLEGAQIGTETLQAAAGLPQLEELDLSSCPIDDQMLAALREQATIQTLWLSSTPITNASLEILGSLKNLRYCDVDGTQITASAWQAFLRNHPQLATTEVGPTR